MKRLLFLALAAGFLCSCGNSDSKSFNTKTDDGSKAAAEKQIAQKEEVDGKAIYKLYCLTCHGPEGNMGGSGAFDLTATKLTLEEKIVVITKGRNTMTPYEGILSEEEIAAVAKYSHSFVKAGE